MAPGLDSLVRSLRDHALHRPDQPVYHALAAGADAPVNVATFGGLDREARAIAVALRERCAKSGRALLLYPPGLEFLSGFFGCLYAGVVPVPVYPPNPARLERTLPRLQAVAADADASVLLGTTALLSFAGPLLDDVAGLARVGRLATDEVDGTLADGWREPDVDSHAPAFIQYTSGSTSTPKGVVLSHSNVLANCRQMREKIGSDPQAGSRFVSWLPLYHDFGLITSALYTVWSGEQSWMMSPLDFMADPLSWLEAIGRYGGTVSAAPNFAFDLCVRRATSERLATLDLSSWRLALCGGEPVSQRTLERFATTFEPCGLRPECLYPAYGMAECVVVVTGGRLDRRWRHRRVEAEALAGGAWRHAGPDDARSQELVGCGEAMAGSRVRIVDPDTRRPCPSGRVGEIWISGPHVGLGYWNRPEESEQVFHARLEGDDGTTYLRSGDLGVIEDGELFVTGRRKDVIFVAGRNIYPQDIERTVTDAHPSLRLGATAAFGVAGGVAEDIVVVQEVGRGATGDLAAVCEAIRRSVQAEHALPLSRIVLIGSGGIPKTSSGKIQRRATRAALDAGELPVVHDWRPSYRLRPPAPAARPRQPHVCVIGAGPAGLTAALALQQRGYDRITVLDRADRVGGRTTDYHDPEGGYYGDVFLATDRYTTIRALADQVGAAPVFEDPAVARPVPVQDLRLPQRFLWSPHRVTSVEEHLRYMTAHLDSSHHDTALAELLTMSGYGFPADVSLPYFRMLGGVVPPTRHTSTRFHVRPRFFPDLWQRVARRLTDQPGTQLLLRTEVTGVRVEAGAGVSGDGPLIRVRTTSSPDGTLFDRVLVAALPRDVLRFLDPGDYAAVHDLLGRVRYVDYAITAFTATGLTGARYVLDENFQPARRGHVMAVHRRGEVFYALQYGDGNTDPEDCLAADVAALGGTVERVLLHRRQPFFPHVAADDLASGYYRAVEGLQGGSNTFFLGALPGFDLTETAARHATALVEDRFDRYNEPPAVVEDDNEGQFERWIDLVRRFPAAPPQVSFTAPRYFRLPDSDQVQFTSYRDERVVRGVLDLDVDPTIDAALRRGPWALTGRLPVTGSFIVAPSGDTRYGPISVLTMKIDLPAESVPDSRSSTELWLAFSTLPPVVPLTVKWGCELMEAGLNGEQLSPADTADAPLMHFGKAHQGVDNPLVTPYETSGTMAYETADEFAVLHLVPHRFEGGAVPRDGTRPINAIAPHLRHHPASFDVMVQARPKHTLPFAGPHMERDGFAKWNDSLPWSSGIYPLHKLGTLTFPVQEVGTNNFDDMGMTAAHVGMPFDEPLPEPPLLVPPMIRTFRRITRMLQPVTEAEFRRTSRETGIEEMLVTRVREICGTPVDRTSNLVELGLSSVELTQLAQYTQAALQVDVPATVLFDLPDLGAVVAYLQAAVEGRTYTPDRRIRTIGLRSGRRTTDPGAASTAVYCFPPIIGSGDVYRTLSADLGGAVVLRTMNDLQLYQEVPRDVMLPDMARAYAEEIQRGQPEGPYHVLGYSFGGLLAYETAHVLTGRGACIATIVCLDGPAPHALTTLARRSKGTVDPDTLTGRMVAAMLAGGSRYAPPRLGLTVELVRARDDKVFDIGDETLGWAQAGVRTSVHWVTGDHLSMMRRPAVSAVADIIRGVLAAPLPRQAASR